MDISPDLVQAKAAIEFGLLALPGVVGVGLGAREENEQFFDELAVRILVNGEILGSAVFMSFCLSAMGSPLKFGSQMGR